MTVTTADEKASREIRRMAMLRYYSEHLAKRILEIEKLQGEAMKLVEELANLENEGR